jgi:hypothetical protein
MAPTSNLDPTSTASQLLFEKPARHATCSRREIDNPVRFSEVEISLDDNGEEGGGNRRLELAFGSRTKGYLVLTERGQVSSLF